MGEVARAAALVLGLALVGCDSQGAAPADGSADAVDAAADGRIQRPDTGVAGPDSGHPGFVPTEPAAPNIPWLDAGPLGPVTSLPVLTPCPPGWREIPPEDELSPATCDPWPEGGMQECADDEAHFPGEPGCTRIGPACPAGDWADDLPTGRRILYVRAGEPPGGDGTRERPFGRIADALAIAVDGDVIALSKGVFHESIAPDAGVALWGACAADTDVLAPPGSAEPAADLAAVAATLRQMTIVGGAPALSVTRGADVELRDLVIREPVGVGILVDGGSVDAASVVVAETQDDGAFGEGMVAANGGLLQLERVAVLAPARGGILVEGPGSSATVRDVLVRDVRIPAASRTHDPDGVGLLVHDGGSLDASRLVVERSLLAVLGFGTSAPARVVLSDTVTDNAVSVQQSAHAELARIWISDATTSSLWAQGDDCSLSGEHVVISGKTRTTDGSAPAFSAYFGARTTLRYAWLEGGVHSGVVVDGGSLDLSDAVVLRTQPNPDPARPNRGIGIDVDRGGSASITRVALLDNRDIDVLASEAPEGAITTVRLEDVLVRSAPAGGVAVEARHGAVVEVSRLVIESCSGYALGAYAALDSGAAPRSLLRLADVVVDACDAEPLLGAWGNAVLAGPGAEVVANRIWARAASEIGIVAYGVSTSVQLADVRIEATRPRACATSSCPGLGFGYGVGAYDAAAITLTRFVVADNEFGGVQLANDGTIDLHDGRISGHAVGANVQSTGFDVARLFDRVLFVDNDVDVDGAALAVPGAPEEVP